MVITTRSGRTVKKPVVYAPAEESMLDDFSDDDYNSSVESTSVFADDEESIGSSASGDEADSDADSSGNLKDFVVDSDVEDSDYQRSDLDDLEEEFDFDDSDDDSDSFPLKKKKNKKTIQSTNGNTDQ